MKLFPKAASSKLIAFLWMSLLTTTVAAQGVGSVVESTPFTPGQSRSSAANPPVANNDGLSLLLDQNRQLQAEVQALRAMVEEQSFEIRKLQRDSLSRYTNTDERLSALESSAATSSVANSSPAIRTLPANTGAADTGLNRAASNAPLQPSSNAQTAIATRTPINSNARPTSRSGRATLQPAVVSEQQLYQMAYDSVINSNFERSLAEFDQYLSVYPQGRFVSNAHYWKGQAYLYSKRYEEARESYELIMNETPASAKLPAAMYGLALTYEGMGNITQARQLLNDIKRNHPNTGEANLATTRLLSL